MNNSRIKSSFSLQDSISVVPNADDTLSVKIDTIVYPEAIVQTDTSLEQLPPVPDTTSVPSTPPTRVQDTASSINTDRPKPLSNEVQGEISIREIVDIQEQKPVSKLDDKPVVDNFSLFAKNDSQLIAVKPQKFLRTEYNQTVNPPGNLEKIIHKSKLSHLNWTLMVGLLCVILLLILKTYYKKLTSRILNTLVNFQLADKILREKNMIVRRAFFIMNLNYVLVVSLFILLLSTYFEFRITSNYPLDYLLISAVIIGILLVRLFVYYLTGYLFERLPSVVEHIHMVYLVNKNLGLGLLPVSFIAIYTEARFSEILLFFGIGILAIATVYKLIRGFQIIFRSGVLLFYSILYLCTLEVLPLLLGAKLIISLR